MESTISENCVKIRELEDDNNGGGDGIDVGSTWKPNWYSVVIIVALLLINCFDSLHYQVGLIDKVIGTQKYILFPETDNMKLIYKNK